MNDEIKRRIKKIRTVARVLHLISGVCIGWLVLGLSVFRPHVDFFLDVGVWFLVVPCLVGYGLCYANVKAIERMQEK